MTFQPTLKHSDGLDFHFFILNSYSFDAKNTNEDEVLNVFINTDFFLDNYVFDKKEKSNFKSHGPFDIEKLKTSDFKKFKAGQLDDLIQNLIQEDDWGDDLVDFKRLWSKSKQTIDNQKMQNGTLYHLNNSWFSENNQQTWDKHLQYTYFMTFVYISNYEQRIVAFDFGYD